ncbi:putative DNA-binding protein [Breznakibacter xylanolyticus]|uniref:Putative DNA-binding protein n=1 Tax=Breznakibacter xylanolyticus TaxID=990 RepID=A0A2W7MPM6_9BACT|nr:ATP-binding protein [Breznakibacter xylanolyticus]PZX10145.1 putative DNA-binding protein [Breznakibacter xylanolyticus]
MSAAGKHLARLIEQGEHDQQDFKFAINDSKKIARSIAAFANTRGGRLLIGVKDNGNIAGVRSDEEFYMIEAAANLYCQPTVPFEWKEWQVNGKSVLEIIIAPGNERPYQAPNKDGKPWAYVRVRDQNLPANPVLIKAWRQIKHSRGALFNMSGPEKILIDYLNEHANISKSRFIRIAAIKPHQADKILVNLLTANLIRTHISEKEVTYSMIREDEAVDALRFFE